MATAPTSGWRRQGSARERILAARRAVPPRTAPGRTPRPGGGENHRLVFHPSSWRRSDPAQWDSSLYSADLPGRGGRCSAYHPGGQPRAYALNILRSPVDAQVQRRRPGNALDLTWSRPRCLDRACGLCPSEVPDLRSSLRRPPCRGVRRPALAASHCLQALLPLSGLLVLSQLKRPLHDALGVVWTVVPPFASTGTAQRLILVVQQGYSASSMTCRSLVRRPARTSALAFPRWCTPFRPFASPIVEQPPYYSGVSFVVAICGLCSHDAVPWEEFRWVRNGARRPRQRAACRSRLVTLG
jgi:hypothetical protein